MDKHPDCNDIMSSGPLWHPSWWSRWETTGARSGFLTTDFLVAATNAIRKDPLQPHDTKCVFTSYVYRLGGERAFGEAQHGWWWDGWDKRGWGWVRSYSLLRSSVLLPMEFYIQLEKAAWSLISQALHYGQYARYLAGLRWGKSHGFKLTG